MLYQIVYSSESVMPMETDELEQILEHARLSNSIHGITGVLVYAEGSFLQILEGDKETVEKLMEKIRRDLRHESVTVLREGEAASARFENWKMAYVGATRDQVSRWAGLAGVISQNSAHPDDTAKELQRTTQFAQDILALLVNEEGTSAEV